MPCCRHPLWDSFALHPFAVWWWRRCPISSICSTKSTVRALLLRDGLSIVMALKAVCLSDTVIHAEQWQAQVVTSSGYQWVAALQQLVCVWLWGSELGHGEWGGSAGQVRPSGGTREASAKHLLWFPCWGDGWGLLLFTSKHQLMKPLKSASLWICFM